LAIKNYGGTGASFKTSKPESPFFPANSSGQRGAKLMPATMTSEAVSAHCLLTRATPLELNNLAVFVAP
jgi:hypothetical protein